MDLINCNIEESVIRNSELKKYMNNILEIKQFYFREYDRKYDVYTIKNNETEYVLMSNVDSYEENILRELKVNGIHFMPELKVGI